MGEMGGREFVHTPVIRNDCIERASVISDGIEYVYYINIWKYSN